MTRQGDVQARTGAYVNKQIRDWPWGGVVDVPAKQGRATAVVVETTALALQADAPPLEDVMVLFAQWMKLDVADGSASPETIRAYMTDVRQHLVWLYDAGLTVPMAGDDDLKAYRTLLVETYAISTVGRKLAAIRRFYEMAHSRGAIPTNPAARLSTPSDKTDRSERIKYFTWTAVQRLLKMPTEQHTGAGLPQGLRDRAMMTLMAMHGLRVSEVAGLSLGDFEADGGESGTLRVLGKGQKYRTALLTEESRLVLDAWLNARNLMHVENDAIFVTLHWGIRSDEEARHRMTGRSIRAIVDGYLKKAGLKRPGMSCHSLRHSYATLSTAAGAKLLAISQSMGHSSVTTTQVYAKIVDKAKNNPAKLLGGLLDE